MRRKFTWPSVLVAISLVYRNSHAFLIPSGGGGGCACSAPSACPPQPVCQPPPPPPPCPCSTARSGGKMVGSEIPLNPKELITDDEQSLIDLSNREIRRRPAKKSDSRDEAAARSLHMGTVASDTTAVTAAAVDISVRPAAGLTVSDGGATAATASLAPQTLTGITGVMMERDADLMEMIGRGDNQSFTIKSSVSSTERPFTDSTPPSSDTTGSSKCNSQVLRKLIIENINEWNSAESKRAINAAAEHKFGGVVDVVCSRGHFSYVYSSSLFCEASKSEMTCIAFRQGSSSPNAQSATTATPIPNEAATSSSSSVVANQ